VSRQWFSGARRKKAKPARATLDEVFLINLDFDRTFVESVAPYRDTADLDKLINALRKPHWHV
jgi:hypothetical protein